jgi:two-component system, NarL family, sensor histidine kinase UhpB
MHTDQRFAGALLPRVDAGGDEQYVRRLNTVLEEQARAIGQSLHDEAGQLLTAAYLALAEASRDLPAPVGERLLVVKRHLEGVEEHLRHVAQELHPRRLEQDGFVAALEFLGRGFAARHSISTEVQARVPRRLPDPIATALYRVAQEGLTNIGRHARATRAHIRVAPKGGVVRFTIRDDGVGFDMTAVAKRGGAGLGLPGMRERIETLGGVLTIRSAAGAGTQLLATIPLGN